MWTDCLLLLLVTLTSGVVSSPTLTDVALKKPSSQSSSYLPLTADRGNDGVRDTCQSTAPMFGNHWWAVDLKGFYEIWSVEITNRIDVFVPTFEYIIIQVFLVNPWQAGRKMNVCHGPVGPMAKNKTKNFQCNRPLAGRYVQLMLPDYHKWISVCDVKVFARVPAAFPSRVYVRAKGRKGEGVVRREMTSRGVVECLGWCTADPTCRAVNIKVPTWTSEGRSHVCQLLGFGGYGFMPDTTVPDPDWNFHAVADKQPTI